MSILVLSTYICSVGYLIVMFTSEDGWLTFPSGFRNPSYTFHMSSGPAEHTNFPTSNKLRILLVDNTCAPWLTDDEPDLSLENIVPAVDGTDGRLLPRRKSDQPILSDIWFSSRNGLTPTRRILLNVRRRLVPTRLCHWNIKTIVTHEYDLNFKCQ